MKTAQAGNVLLEVASLCMRLGGKHVEPYSHRNSPHGFTQRQLLTCLVLKAYRKATDRGVIELLEVSEGLRARIGLEGLPHFTTLQKFARQSSILEVIDAMLLEIVRRFATDADEAAIDSTELETSSASAPDQARRGKSKNKDVKLSVCVMGGSLLPSGLVVRWGPNKDKKEAPDLLAKAGTASQPKRLFADAGYDAEWVHRLCREDWRVQRFLKPAVHRSDGGINDNDRSQMTSEALREESYDDAGWSNPS
jgi:hypothetical protein